jgi:hypothetical protein
VVHRLAVYLSSPSKILLYLQTIPIIWGLAAVRNAIAFYDKPNIADGVAVLIALVLMSIGYLIVVGYHQREFVQKRAING